MRIGDLDGGQWTVGRGLGAKMVPACAHTREDKAGEGKNRGLLGEIKLANGTKLGEQVRRPSLDEYHAAFPCGLQTPKHKSIQPLGCDVWGLHGLI